MSRQRMNLLRSYRYDPLDRLVACVTSGQASTQRFYLRDRLVTEIQGTVQHSIMQHDDHLLAQQQRQGSATVETSLLGTDQQRSVLTLLDTKQPHAFAYMPYGYFLAGNGLLSLLGFNGERPDLVTGWYLLGNGYHRPFDPVLMRFICPDSWSPFGEGGVNAYVYCSGDPVNRSDSTGRSWGLVKANLRLIGGMNRISQPGLSTATNRVAKSGIMTNINRIGENVFSFEDIYKGKRRLNFSAHGEETAIDTASRIGVNGERWNANQLYSDALKRGVDFNKIDNVRILACFSGHGGSRSFAATFSRLSNTPTKGFIGEITAFPRPEAMEKLFSAVKSQFPLEPFEFVNSFHREAHFIRKVPKDELAPHNYKSIRFQP